MKMTVVAWQAFAPLPLRKLLNDQDFCYTDVHKSMSMLFLRNAGVSHLSGSYPAWMRVAL